jgi:chromosome partitioning protein
MLILFAGEKGGSGKSSLAVQIGILRVLRGGSAVIIDSDPQATANNWINRRTVEPKINCLQMNGSDFYNQLPALVDEYDDIIIDIAGRDSEEMRRALGFVDVVVFPVRPTINDLETAPKMDKLVGQFLNVSHIKKAFFVLSQASTNVYRKATNQDAINYLKACDNIETTQTIIFSRSAYEKASLQGLAVDELRPSATKAKEEINKLYNDIFDHDCK